MPEADYKEFVQLYSKHYFELFRYVATLEANRADAEDVMQEVSVKLWEKFDQFDPGRADFFTWARGFARNRVLKSKRSHARRRCRLDNDLLTRIADELPDDQSRLDAQRQALEHCLGRLGADARRLIVERYQLEHGDLSGLAKQLGRSANALSIALHRIRRQLAKCTNTKMRQEGWA